MNSPASGPSRVIELEGGSNFRDLGGYPTNDGRTTRWRYIFRSGSLGNLTAADIERLDALEVSAVLDLRCRAESDLVPGRWSTPEIHSIDYATELVFAKALGSESMDLYRSFPELLSPHIRWLMKRLLDDRGPVVVHCSGGQDRTGVVVGVLLAALGVPIDQIVADYMLTTDLRRRTNELDLGRVESLAKDNPVAAFYSRVVAERGASALDPRPLLDPGGRPKIVVAFEAIDDGWGSFDHYLEGPCGLGAEEREQLKECCLM